MVATQDHKSAIFTAAHVEWGTPPDLYQALDKEFGFTLDPCKPGGVWDGTYVSWEGERVFCNPPYGRGIGKWLAKGREAELAVFLVPARTDTSWFHDYALHADEIRFFRGRLKFNEDHITPCDYSKRFAEMHGAPFPSMLVIFNGKGNSG
jgi:site-specific DNA-methyltransferase (adenine-specific)